MTVSRDIRTGRHWAFLRHAHRICVTKFRYKVFPEEHLTRMEEVMKDVCADFEVDLVEFNGEPGHVHLLVHFPPMVALAKLVNSLKGVSSRRLRQEFIGMQNRPRQTGNDSGPACVMLGSPGRNREDLDRVDKKIRG